jgi:signal transduction histidine kinase
VLPVRAATAYEFLHTLQDSEASSDRTGLLIAPLDPAWMLERSRKGDAASLDLLIAERDWWPALDPESSAALNQLWGHSLLAAASARWLAAQAGLSDPEPLIRAAMLHRLGLWILAAQAPEHLAQYLAMPQSQARRDAAIAWLGADVDWVGRHWAERWDCEALLIEATWLHLDRSGRIRSHALDPEHLRIVQQAAAWAELSPWRLDPGAPAPIEEPRLRLLIAEVHSRLAPGFLDPDVSPREIRWAQACARQRIQRAEMAARAAPRLTFLDTIASLGPEADLRATAESAARDFCALPGIASARVLDLAAARLPVAQETEARPAALHATPLRIELLPGPAPELALELRLDPLAAPPTDQIQTLAQLYRLWIRNIASRDRLARQLVAARDALDQSHGAGPFLPGDRLAALAEFAAGAGHELNNPLAVIQGRAQLLRARTADPDARRSLGTIVEQAQRAHRILRDLIYVARPPQPSLRGCCPDAILNASLEDLRAEAARRSLKLQARILAIQQLSWADLDALRHLADALIRNAIEATPPGGLIEIIGQSLPHELRWQVRDSGPGLSERDAQHLFDPFYCGRQAGRGLGLGLPRAARFLEQAGGRIEWQSQPGHGTLFRVHLPLRPIPPAPNLLPAPARAGVD